MNKKNKSLSEIYKQHIATIIVLIASVIIAVFILAYINIDIDYKDSVLVNSLGKQRMLTQIMAKDSGRVYELQTLINNGSGEAEKENTRKLLEQTLKSLKEARDDYDKQFLTISRGYINYEDEELRFNNTDSMLKDILEKHNPLWLEFRAKVDEVLEGYTDETRLLEGVKYIYKNNEALLKYSNDITSIVQNNQKSQHFKLYYGILFLVVVLLVTLIFFVRRAYKNLFKPVGQLYKKMGDLGIAEQQNNCQLQTVNKQEDEPNFAEVNAVFNKLNSLISLIENISKNVPFKDVLNYIFHSFAEYIPYSHIGVALIRDDGKELKACYGVSHEVHKNLVNKLLGYTAEMDYTSLGKILHTGQERIINDLEAYTKNRPKKLYNEILLEEGVRSSITFPLKNNNKVVGIIFFSSDKKNVYTEEHIKFLKTLANSIMLSLEEDILIEDMIIGSTLALAALTEERDPETGEHLHRMKTYARIIAELLSKEEKFAHQIDMEFINNIERFAPLHDIGKVAIRDEILLKPGKLTPEEFETMKTHASYGANVLKRAEENVKKRGRTIFKMAIEIAEGHHEKWNGTGYPYGKKGVEIPLSARIVAIADVLDALTSRRPYKEPFSFETSVDMILEGAGKHFDPEIIFVFFKHVEVIKRTYEKFKKNRIL